MAKTVIRLTEEELKRIIVETTQALLNKPTNVSLSPNGLITEMARINKRESGRGIFPYNSYVVRIWSNDHEPPHFHIEKDGWNILITIDDGELYRIEQRGRDLQTYNYVLSNAKRWLQSRSAISPSLTNQQNALSIWEQLHDE